MSTIVTRAGKGSPLTHVEVDANFTNLNTDKVEKTSADITGGTINGTTIGATTPAAGKFTTLESTGTGSFGTTSAQYIQAVGNATEPQILAVGSGTNIPLVLQPKGTGALQAQATTSTTAGGNVRGANAVDWQTSRSAASQVASAAGGAVLAGGVNNTVSAFGAAVLGGGTNSSGGNYTPIVGGLSNTSTGQFGFIGGGSTNTLGGTQYPVVVGGYGNTAGGWFNFIGNGFTNSGTSAAAVTTQATTTVTSGSTAVTLSGSNASIKVGQQITGTGIVFPSYVAAISGTALTLSQNASATGTPTLSFFTPHGVVVGGGNNQATGSYSFIGGGGDAGTAANRNVASGAWSFVGGGGKNTASGAGSAVVGGGTDGGGNYFANTASGITAFIGGGWNNTAGGQLSTIAGGTSNNASAGSSFIGGGDNHVASGGISAIMGGRRGTTRALTGYHVFPACYDPLGSTAGASQAALLVLAKQTTDATATALTSDGGAAGTTNQVILPNNSAYLFKATVISGVTGGGNTSGWKLEGVIKRGANAASTTIVGTVTTTLLAQDAGASGWVIAATADTTNGGLRITFTGQASTTIRTVAKVETTEVTY